MKIMERFQSTKNYPRIQTEIKKMQILRKQQFNE